jgi:SPP1 gp7 family putative phage head morphogenesis protein
MPLRRCTKDGQGGWQWGDAGVCYIGPLARQRALKQAAAIKATGYTGNQRKPTQADLDAPAVGPKANPLALDPTRTTMLRRRYMAEMNRRFRALRGAIWQTLVKEDALGLGKGKPLMLQNAAAPGLVVNNKWAFLSDPEKADAFQNWFEQQVEQDIFAPIPGAAPVTPADLAEPAPTIDPEAGWQAEFVESSYMKGVTQAYADTHAEAMAAGLSPAVFEGGQQAFLASSFSGRVRTSKLKLLAQRNFQQLKGVTAAMGQALNRILSDGLVAGHNPTKIAKAMNKEIEGLTKKRALTIAKTEIIHAHAEGQLDSFSELGVEEVGALAEWATAGDGKVCDKCSPLEGAILTIKEARGLIPRHPNCRCMWLPAGVGEATTGQTWAKDIIDDAFRLSMKRETGEQDGKKARAKSKWLGSTKKIKDKGKLKPTKKNKTKAAADLEAKKAAKAAESAAAKAKAAELAAARAAAKAKAAELTAKKKAAGKQMADLKERYGLQDPSLFGVDPEGVAVLTPAGEAALKKAKGAKAHSKKVKVGMAKGHFTKKHGVGADGIKVTPAGDTVLTFSGKVEAIKGMGFTGIDDPLFEGPAVAEFIAAKDIVAQKEAILKIKHPLYKKLPTPTPTDPALKQWLESSHIKHRALGKADLTKMPGWGGDGPKSYGGVIMDEKGRVLLREPKGHFGGYSWTWPKGGAKPGQNPVQAALDEVAEETGHKGRIVGMLNGGFEGGTSTLNMFIMKSDGFDHTKMDAETKGLRWVTKEEAAKLIKTSKNKKGRDRDLAILEAAYADADTNKTMPIAKSPTMGTGVQVPFFEKMAEAPKPKPKPAAGQPELPQDMADLKYVKTLQGSTRPTLQEDRQGKRWVVKQASQGGLEPDHIKSEALADQLYQTLGYDVPAGHIVNTADGPAKITEFLDGQTLSDWKRGKTKAQREAVYEKLHDGFIADALFANHDVAGLSFDNIFIGDDGTPYRIDNGGALLYRAQGQPKQDFGRVVRELESMRGPKNRNAVTAEIFANLPEAKMHKQIRHIASKRADLRRVIAQSDIDAAKKLQLLETVDERIDYLQGLLPKADPVDTSKRVRGGRRDVAAYEVDAEFVDRVKKSRVNGVSLAGDARDVEDNDVLVWEQKDAAGDDTTRISMKLTAEGSQKVEAALKQVMDAAEVTATRGPAPTLDPKKNPQYINDQTNGYFEKIKKGYKTAYTHRNNGAYNETTLQEMADAASFLEWLAENGTGEDAEMARYYVPHAKAVQDAVKAGKKATVPGGAPMMDAYIPRKLREQDKPAKDTPPPTGMKAKLVPVRRTANDFSNGFALEKTDANYPKNALPGQEYIIDAGDGVQINFMPRQASDSTEQRAGLALEGTFEVTLAGGMTPDQMTKAKALARTMGIDLDPPTPEFEESLYIHRTIAARGRDKKGRGRAEYNRIWKDDSLTDAQRVAKQKAWVSKNMGIDLPDEPTEWYDPAGRTSTSVGDGRRQWAAWDMTAEAVAKELPKENYVIQHTVGGLQDTSRGRVEGALKAMLQSGGELTSTTQRLRKGVPIFDKYGNQIGDTPTADINTGGATTAFTRLRKRRDSERVHGIFFKMRNVRRADAVHYQKDKYGALSYRNTSEHMQTVDRMKSATERIGNELLFKNGISLLDEIDVIRVWDDEERDKVLDIFKENKVTHMPDGRPVAEIVIRDRFRDANRKYDAYGFEERGRDEAIK